MQKVKKSLIALCQKHKKPNTEYGTTVHFRNINLHYFAIPVLLDTTIIVAV